MMTASRKGWVGRCKPSFTDAAFLLPVAALLLLPSGVSGLLGDADTGWHIRTGEWILEHRRVPDRDIFSFTKAGEPWFAWEWGSDVILAWLYRHGGLEAVVLGSLAVLCATFALLCRLVRSRCTSGPIALGVTAMAAAGSSIHWLARPHLFTLLFVVVFLHILQRARQGRHHTLWLLIPLSTLWANLHGAFFVGAFLVACFGLGELVGGVLDKHQARRQAFVRASYFFLATAGCLGASLINPYFYKLHLHVLSYLRDPQIYKHIDEFQGANFQHPAARSFGVLLLLGVMTIPRLAREKRWAEAILVATWTWLALMVARNVPIALLVVAPAVASQVDGFRLWLKSQLPGSSRSITESSLAAGVTPQLTAVPALGLAALALLGVSLYSPDKPTKLTARFDPKRYPEAAIASRKDCLLSTRLFTTDEWGDFLIYKLFPDIRVFIDGRSDMYGPALAEQYLKVLTAQPEWREVLGEHHRIEAVLVPARSAISTVLREASDWQKLYEDDVAVLFKALPRTELDRQLEHQAEAPSASAKVCRSCAEKLIVAHSGRAAAGISPSSTVTAASRESR